MRSRMFSVFCLVFALFNAISLSAANGALKVTSFPSGAGVIVDGIDTGKVTPMSVSLSEGDHVVTVQIPNSGWTPDTRIVSIVSGNNDLSVTLLPVLTQGPVGPAGPIGPTGIAGPTGAQGPTGPIGLTGANGTNGTNGTNGANGANGATGAAGATGATGEKGDQGVVGPAGATGEKGEKGDQGDAGPTGPTGDKGDPGIAGPTGPTGEKGDQGDVGPMGPAGPAIPFTSINSLAGLACGAGSSAGVVSITTSAGGAISMTCTPVTPVTQPNVAFVSSQTFPTTLGSAQAYDQKCNVLATAAGINNAAGNGFVAWISSPSSNAISRLPASGGWTRIDGKPFASSRAALAAGHILYPLNLDEHGLPTSDLAMTGTAVDGTASPNETCHGWTGGLDYNAAGVTDGGPVRWTRGALANCSVNNRIYCLGTTSPAQAVVPAATGTKLAFLSTTNHAPPIGLEEADAACQIDAAASGLPGTYAALLATMSSPAFSRFNPLNTYARRDGVVIGTVAQLASGLKPISGFWETSAGAYEQAFTWTGSETVTAHGGVNDTCNDWSDTSTSSRGAYGYSSDSQYDWFFNNIALCNATARFYCLQQ